MPPARWTPWPLFDAGILPAARVTVGALLLFISAYRPVRQGRRRRAASVFELRWQPLAGVRARSLADRAGMGLVRWLALSLTHFFFFFFFLSVSSVSSVVSVVHSSPREPPDTFSQTPL